MGFGSCLGNKTLAVIFELTNHVLIKFQASKLLVYSLGGRLTLLTPSFDVLICRSYFIWDLRMRCYGRRI